MKSRAIVTAVVAAGLMMFASLSSAEAGLLGGGCGCEPKCCAPNRSAALSPEVLQGAPLLEAQLPEVVLRAEVLAPEPKCCGSRAEVLQGAPLPQAPAAASRLASRSAAAPEPKCCKEPRCARSAAASRFANRSAAAKCPRPSARIGEVTPAAAALARSDAAAEPSSSPTPRALGKFLEGLFAFPPVPTMPNGGPSR
jgi:hypothetical protein